MLQFFLCSAKYWFAFVKSNVNEAMTKWQHMCLVCFSEMRSLPKNGKPVNMFSSLYLVDLVHSRVIYCEIVRKVLCRQRIKEQYYLSTYFSFDYCVDTNQHYV